MSHASTLCFSVLYISTSVFTTEVKAKSIKIYYAIKSVPYGYIKGKRGNQHVTSVSTLMAIEKPPMWAGETAMS